MCHKFPVALILPAHSCWVLFCRYQTGCRHATMWPYPRDAAYFRLMAWISSLCWFAVFAIEVYAIW
jgi:hypothetical protein